MVTQRSERSAKSGSANHDHWTKLPGAEQEHQAGRGSTGSDRELIESFGCVDTSNSEPRGSSSSTLSLTKCSSAAIRASWAKKAYGRPKLRQMAEAGDPWAIKTTRGPGARTRGRQRRHGDAAWPLVKPATDAALEQAMRDATDIREWTDGPRASPWRIYRLAQALNRCLTPTLSSRCCAARRSRRSARGRFWPRITRGRCSTPQSGATSWQSPGGCQQLRFCAISDDPDLQLFFEGRSPMVKDVAEAGRTIARRS